MGGDDYYAEQSADEIFSGPTHELVPSSYSSFHHHHWPHHATDDEDLGEGSGAEERRNSFWSQRRASDLVSVPGDDEDEELVNFHFFSRDEISHAEGASTVIGDDDSAVSFITNSTERESMITGLVESDDEADHDHHALERRMLLDDSDSVRSGSAAEREVDHKFEYRSSRVQQRYYIAEEDMRIVCAGYSIIRVRLWLYYALCMGTAGLLYLIFRWFPRQRLRLVARETPLGRCDFIVVENQWGELDTVEIDVQRYNHALSTIFNLQMLDQSDHREDTAENGGASNSTPPTTNSDTQAGRSRRSSWSSYIDSDPNVPYLRVLTYRYIRFIYNPVRDMFLTNSDWVGDSWGTEETAAIGLDGEVQARREQVFGKNSLEITQPGVVKLLVDEVLHPFYIFQVFSVILWLLDEYVYYALAILIISVSSVAEALMETKKSITRLQEVAQANSDSEITVLRSGYWLTIPSAELVPGDVYELSDPTLTMIPVDSVLLSGDCIVNESILTGESVPVTKLPASDKALSSLVEQGPRSSGISRSFLYSGTKIIRVRKPPAENDDFLPALAMTVRTGFSTTKGALVRSMMFPRPNGFSFYRDSFRYIGVMAFVAMIGFSYSAVKFVSLGMDSKVIIMRALDIITVVIPPALPATLTIGTNFSLSRLRSKSIFCITPSRVNVSGRVNVVVFDKTGTLTEEGLDVLGVHLVGSHHNGIKFGPLRRSARELARESDTSLLDTLVTCHELRSVDGELVGDPLDVRMFEFTGWSLEEDRKQVVSPTGRALHVFKQFEFGSQLRRMSVIADSGGHQSSLRVLAKGAPEIMREICRPETMPANFDTVLHQYTHRGYRVIACAWREVGDISDYDRNELESNLVFAGFIIFENKLKAASKPTIEKLKAASIRTVMCTGDNVLTAVSVGRECAIIPSTTAVFAAHFDDNQELKWEGVDDSSLRLKPFSMKPETDLRGFDDYTLAITGDVFSHIVETANYEALDQMLLRGSIFARMSPDEKHELVSKLQQIDYTVCFCGDGANDCGALKEADVGISLSEAEASVAAPFTSRRFDISCVLDVLAEGRCALSTSFSCFKYMSLYSAIQFVTVTLLYSYGTNIGDFQFLWIDLFLIVPIAAFMAWSGPAPTLSRKRPGAELVSRKVLIPLLSSMAVFGCFQVFTWEIGRQQPWYVPPAVGNSDDLKNTDNTLLFFVSSFQYIIAGWLVCEGLPFRLPVSQNGPFLMTVVVTTGVSIGFMLMDPASSLGRLMDLTATPFSFDMELVLLVIVNLVVLLLARDYAYTPIFAAIRRIKQRMGIKKTRPRYKEIMEEDKLEV